MEITTLTLEAAPIIFAFQRFQSTISTKMVIRTTEVSSMALSMNSLLRKIAMTTMHLVQSAMSSHVVQCRWCPLGMTVHLDGARSIMGIWWLNINYSHKNQKDFICVDRDAEAIPSSSANKNGALLFLVEGKCGQLPCGPYVAGRELTCAVCTKWRKRLSFLLWVLTGDESVIFENELYWF